MDDHHDVGQDSGDHGASGTERTGGGRARWLAGGGPLVAYAWWAVSLPPFSGGATVAVLVAGAAAWAWGSRERHGRRPVGRRDLAPWAIVAGAAGVWQLAAYLQGPRADHPTLSSLANAVLDSQPSRAAAFALWLAIAAGLARR